MTKVDDGASNDLETYTLDQEDNRITSHLATIHVTDPANRVNEDEKFFFEYDVNRYPASNCEANAERGQLDPPDRQGRWFSPRAASLSGVPSLN